MPGGPTTTTQSNQSSQSSPWAPTQPALNSLISGIGGFNTGVSGQQSGAMNSLLGSASGLPNFGAQGTNTANQLFGGGGANNQAGTVQGAYGNLQSSLSPLTNPANLNPMSTPGFSDALAHMNSSISNQVNDGFAASGRDGSPGNTQALATGLSQGEGGMIANQYNQNANNLTNASNSLFGAGLNTGNALSGYNQQGNQNQLAGASLAGSIPGLYTSPAQSWLSAANMQQNQPLGNMGAQESLLAPLAALGGQSSGTGTSTSQTQTPLWQQLAGLGIAGAGMFGSAGMGGTSPIQGMQNMWNSSDRRLKDDIEKVGALFDGTPVYRFRYISGGPMQIGLMAQDIEQFEPDAVREFNGFKAVDYGKATERARQIGEGR